MRKLLLSFALCFMMVGVYAQSTDYTVGNLIFNDVLYYNYVNPYQDPSGTWGTAVNDARIVSTYQVDAYDGAFEVAVDDTAFVNAPIGSDTTLVPNTINTTTQKIKGLLVSKHFYFPSNLPIVRLLVKLENPTGTSKSVRVNIASNLGSDSSTQLDSCSSGNTTLSNSDRWAITSDSYPDSDPVLTWVRFGSGTPAATAYFKEKPELGNGNIDDSLNVTVPANSFIYVVQFNRLDSTLEAAKENVSMFDDLSEMIDNELFAGINVSDYSKIVNWDMSSAIASSPTVAASSLNFGSVTSTSFTVNWTNGNGAGRIVIIKAGTAVDTDPLDGTTYTASTVFGSGTQLGTGNYVLYFGTGSSVSVTGLSSNTTYYVKIFEFNGATTKTNYLTSLNLAGSQATNTTGVLKFKESELFSLSPNPNNGNVVIEFPSVDKPSEIRVVNTSGIVVKVIPLIPGASSVNLNTSTLESGLYFLNFSNTGVVKKMIKY